MSATLHFSPLWSCPISSESPNYVFGANTVAPLGGLLRAKRLDCIASLKRSHLWRHVRCGQSPSGCGRNLILSATETASA